MAHLADDAPAPARPPSSDLTPYRARRAPICFANTKPPTAAEGAATTNTATTGSRDPPRRRRASGLRDTTADDTPTGAVVGTATTHTATTCSGDPGRRRRSSGLRDTMPADTPTDVTVTMTTLPNPMIPTADDSLQGRCECAAVRRQHPPTRPSRRTLSSRQSRTLGEARAANTTTRTADMTVVMTAVVAEAATMIGPIILLQAEKQGSEKELVFVELNLREPMAVTSFHVLERREQFLGRCHDVRSCKSIEGKDMDHCYACDHKIRHPIGSKYEGGHFVFMSYYFEDYN